MQKRAPIQRPIHCQTVAPAIVSLTQSGQPSIQRIGMMKLRPIGEATNMS